MKLSINSNRVLIVILLIALLVAPIFDFLSGDESVGGSGPNVILRALAVVVMLLLLIPRKGFFVKFNNSITCCILFLFLYVMTISLLFNPTVEMVYAMIRVLYPLLGFLCFYYLTKNNILNDKLFSGFFLLLIVIVAVAAYLNLGVRMNSRRGLTTADNTGYALVCTYAGVMLLSKKKVFPLALFLVVVGTLICGKRGAIIAMAIATVPLLRYIFFNRQLKTSKKILLVILIAVGAYLALRYFNTYFDAAFSRFENLEEDEGSGRTMVYQAYYLQFSHRSNLINQIFGHGLFGGTFGEYKFTRFNAHNDWLELLFDFGLIGTLLYALVFVSILTMIIKKRKKRNTNDYIILEMSFIIWFVKSIFSSTFLMDVSSIYLYMTAAYAIAKLEQNKIKRRLSLTKPLKHDLPAVSS